MKAKKPNLDINNNSKKDMNQKDKFSILRSEMNQKLKEQETLKFFNNFQYGIIKNYNNIKQVVNNSFTSIDQISRLAKDKGMLAKNYLYKKDELQNKKIIKTKGLIKNNRANNFEVVFQQNAQQTLQQINQQVSSKKKQNNNIKIIVPSEQYQSIYQNFLNQKQISICDSGLSYTEVEKFLQPFNFSSLKYDVVTNLQHALSQQMFHMMTTIFVKIYFLIISYQPEIQNKEFLAHAISQAIKISIYSSFIIFIQQMVSDITYNQKLKFFFSLYTTIKNKQNLFSLPKFEFLNNSIPIIADMSLDIYQYLQEELSKSQLASSLFQNSLKLYLGYIQSNLKGVKKQIFTEFKPLLTNNLSFLKQKMVKFTPKL